MKKNERLVELLFGDVKLKPEEIEERYPSRKLADGAKVTRLAPSPTGFIHLGNLYGAFVDERLAHQSGGRFYLRIEDTDEKRYVEGAVDTIIKSLDYFGIKFDEEGEYGPYYQSMRTDIYRCFAKKLFEKGRAYPCFLSESEIDEIRRKQEADKATPGIYGKYSTYKDMSDDEVIAMLEEGKSFVLRLKSQGREGEAARKMEIEDAIRGRISMPENFHDVVLLKAAGTPTYHFAHVIDDYLMKTTHVVRGEEWLSSLPIHVELFEALGFDMPVYCHTAQLMKVDESGNKRKLSKRKDPELALEYYRKRGYHPKSIREYLLTILNSNYEEWRMANPLADSDEFKFSTEKMSKSGSLFDLDKLNDVAKESLATMEPSDIADFIISWAEDYRPEAAEIMKKDKEALTGLLAIGRRDKKPRKDLIYAEQICDFTAYFYDEYFKIEDEIPAEVSEEDSREIIKRYIESYCHQDDQSVWFDKIRQIAADMGYAVRPKDYKKNPGRFKGHVGHVSTVIRLAIVGRSQSPDIWEIQQVMGEEKIMRRLEADND